MFWRWRNKLKWAPLSFLLPVHYCGLWVGSIPFRAIVNNKQCETRGLFMLLVIHDWIGDVQDSQGVSDSEMTYIMSGGALNSTRYSLTTTIFIVLSSMALAICESSLWFLWAKVGQRQVAANSSAKLQTWPLICETFYMNKWIVATS